MIVPERIAAAFTKEFGTPRDGATVSRAPGRVEVLGNHTDYNGGAVLAAAIERYVWSIGIRSGAIRVHSVDYAETVDIEETGMGMEVVHAWHSYVRGVYWAFRRRGRETVPMLAAVGGDVPIGAGLSSSAALEVSLVNLIHRLSGGSLEPKSLAMLAFEAERIYCNVACGVMDQFASQLCKPDSLLAIDCAKMATKDIPLDIGARLVVVDSGVSRAAGDALNTRKEECRQALQTLNKDGWALSNLVDIDPRHLPQAESVLSTTLGMRTKHVVMENARVKQGILLLQDGRLQEFGRLMYESHESSRDLYEVSHPRLDLLVELSRNHPAVLGARMTGAGLGGAILALVKEKHVEDYMRSIVRFYEKETGLTPRVIAGRVPGGVVTTTL
ncbi:MAG: galactokinase [Candidatus Thorarchaeota archaeon]|nr:galactokinase [Candidatus Thorarchaeota archaeon]